jgi:hypothetical protein
MNRRILITCVVLGAICGAIRCSWTGDRQWVVNMGWGAVLGLVLGIVVAAE